MNVLLVGAGGYASGYVKELAGCEDPAVLFAGIVDPYWRTSKVKDLIECSGVPVYDTMEQFYRFHTAELAIICTPPFLHCEQSICALSNGSYVLCEKPIAPTVEEALRMQEAETRYGRFIAIGYQWSFSDAIQKLKKDVLSGVLGSPLSFKTAISWPRSRAYYHRGTGWGGKIEKDGVMILDSIASNACAHYLHNLFFLLGSDMESSAEVRTLRADCLRANEIETFDTCSIRMEAESGTELYFIASHAAEVRRNPEFLYTFENAVVSFSEDKDSEIRAIFSDGTEKCYGNPFENNFKKLWNCIAAIQNGTTPICTVKTALPHTRLIKRLYEEVPVYEFPKERVHLCEETDCVYADELFQQMYTAYDNGLLLSEAYPTLYPSI